MKMLRNNKHIINLLFALLLLTPWLLYFAFKPQYKFQNGRYLFEYDIKPPNRLHPYDELIYKNSDGDITVIDTYDGDILQRGTIKDNHFDASMVCQSGIALYSFNFS